MSDWRDMGFKEMFLSFAATQRRIAFDIYLGNEPLV